MIIGTDFITELAMDFRFSSQTTLWDDLTDPMRPGQDQYQDNMVYVLATEAPIIKLAKDRQRNRILDANYEAIDLEVKVDAIELLSEHQKKQ